jgi:hypothetical protein
MGWFLGSAGRKIVEYLDRPASGFEPFTPSDPEALLATIKVGDVLLVEGNSHISGAIKYLTQSTWSHAALYVGCQLTGDGTEVQGNVLVEATLDKGVVSAPLSKYFRFHTRICRPIDLSIEDCEAVCKFAVDRIGSGYDHRNIIDLVRYLIPLPVPQRWRRQMIALGSGDPTRFICSGMIAQAFQSIRYPILPTITTLESDTARSEVMRIRHSSLFVPRDFDISPFFEVVKPTIEWGFDYRRTRWAESPSDQTLSSVERQTDEAIPGEASAAPPPKFGWLPCCEGRLDHSDAEISNFCHPQNQRVAAVMRHKMVKTQASTENQPGKRHMATKNAIVSAPSVMPPR